MKTFEVLLYVDTYDEKTARTEIKASLDQNYSLNNVEIDSVEEVIDE